jgi:hypothetical protein
MSEIQRHLEGIRGGNQTSTYQAWRALDEHLDRLNNRIGGLGNSMADNPTRAPQPVPPPPAAAFNVTGIDGKFLIAVANPQDVNPLTPTIAQIRARSGVNTAGTAILHNLQSGTDINFDNNSGVTDYGTSSQLAYEIQDPNQTKFFRMRSSFDGQNWNDWQLFSSVETCGPVGVWSGLLRTPSLAMVNSAAQTVDGINALSQVGVTTAIAIAGKQWNVGPQKITYAGGTTDPGVFGKFIVYAVDTRKAGGVVTYLTTQNVGVLAAQDGIIIFGTITTAGGGGGTGSGGGSCHVAGTPLEMFDGSFKDASEIVKDDELRATDGGKEIAQQDAEPIANVPCFSLEFDNGVTVRGVSSTEPIQLANDTFINVFDSMKGQQFKTRAGIGTLATKTFIGNRLVWRQRLDRTKTFWADGLGSHNMKAFD